MIRRFAHLLAASGVDALLSVPFFVFLARRDAGLYGTVMYGVAIGAVVRRMVLFGLYHPLVRELTQGKPAPRPLASVAALQLGLLILCSSAVAILGHVLDLSSTLLNVALVLAAGMGMEALADTLLAEPRVKGRHHREARLRAWGSLAGYGYGFAAVALGLSPVLVALFRVVAGAVLLVGCLLEVRRDWPAWSAFRPSFPVARALALTGAALAGVQVLGTFYNKSNVLFLERVAGASAVASYSATWMIVEGIALLGSEQFLAAVLFPVLSAAWTRDRVQATRLVAGQARWLLALSLGVVFVLDRGAAPILGLLYGGSYGDAIWMQRILAWSIPLSLLVNLLASLLLAAGAARVLLGLAGLTTLANLALNVGLVRGSGLLGACLVIVLTKLFMLVVLAGYSQRRFRWLELRGAGPLVALVGAALLLYGLAQPVLGAPLAALVTVAAYAAALWAFGERWLGPFGEHALHGARP